jgi:hypothetical protein
MLAAFIFMADMAASVPLIMTARQSGSSQPGTSDGDPDPA